MSESEDYRGNHKAPDRTSGYPMDDLTELYGNEIYELPLNKAIQYFGSHHPADTLIIGLIRAYHNKPNRSVVVYRAVPDLNKEINNKIKKLSNLIMYVDKFGFAPMGDEWARGKFVEFGYNKSSLIGYLGDEIGELEKGLVPRLVINKGDWVTLSPMYAREHGEGRLGGRYKVLRKNVRVGDLYTNGDVILEWGYDPK